MRKKFEKVKRGGIGGIIKGAAISVILYPAIALAAGIICYNTKDPTATVSLYSIFSFVISGGIAGFINAKLFGNGSIGSPLLSSAVALAIYFILSVIIGTGAFSVFSVTNAALYFLSSFLFAIIGIHRRSGRRIPRSSRMKF